MSIEMQVRARYNMRALREAGIAIDKAFREAERSAAQDLDVIGFEFRDAKLFLMLCPDGEHGRPYEEEFRHGGAA